MVRDLILSKECYGQAFNAASTELCSAAHIHIRIDTNAHMPNGTLFQASHFWFI